MTGKRPGCKVTAMSQPTADLIRGVPLFAESRCGGRVPGQGLDQAQVVQERRQRAVVPLFDRAPLELPEGRARSDEVIAATEQVTVGEAWVPQHAQMQRFFLEVERVSGIIASTGTFVMRVRSSRVFASSTLKSTCSSTSFLTSVSVM